MDTKATEHAVMVLGRPEFPLLLCILGGWPGRGAQPT